MNLLIEIGHPAHVHFFYPIIRRLQADGDKVVVVTRNKEITDNLLVDMGIPFRSLTTSTHSRLKMLAELLERWYKIWKIIGKEKIDVIVSISGISTAVPARLRGRPNITITDTEDATLSNRIAFPFTDAILTPEFFLKDFGVKHRRYFGLHELAYLKGFNHLGLEKRLLELGLQQPYSILRLIAYDAAHDWALALPNEEDILQVVRFLEQFGKVYITSQKKLHGHLKDYELQAPITSIHDVLAGAEFFVGESPTMAVEAGLLGTPALLVSARSPGLGNMVELGKRELLVNLESWSLACKYLNSIGDHGRFRKEWRHRATNFVEATVDVADYVYSEIRALTVRL